MASQFDDLILVSAFRQAWLPTSTMNLTIVFNPKAPIVGQFDQHHWRPLWGTGSDFDGCRSPKAEPLRKARSQMEINIWIQISFHLDTDLPDVSDQIPSRFQFRSSGIAALRPTDLGFSDHRPGGLRCLGLAHPPGMARTLQREWPRGQLLQGLGTVENGAVENMSYHLIHKELKTIEMDGT